MGAFITAYPAEISGWDRRQDFFVENTSLEYDLEGTMSVRVRHAVHAGTIVFVRLVGSASLGESFPVALRAASVGPQDRAGLYSVGLEPMLRSEAATQGEAGRGQQRG